MPSTLLRRAIPLSLIESEDIYILKSVTPKYKYEDGKKTDEVTGFSYEVVNTNTYNFYNIVIEGGKKPIITNDELVTLQENGEHVLVEFEYARIRPYYSTLTKQIEDSVKADKVTIVKND